MKTHTTTDFGHGRIETRACDEIDDLNLLDKRKDWQGLKSIIRITSQRIIKKTRKESIENDITLHHLMLVLKNQPKCQRTLSY